MRKNNWKGDFRLNKEDVLKLIQELNDKQTETICIETKTANQGKPEKYYDTISSFVKTHD